MATVTIRNLSDDVVDALKERARRNSRSMEAEVRDVLTRLAQNDASGLEADLAQRVARPRRWSVPASEIMARVDANPSTPEQDRMRREWAAELEADRQDPFFLDPLRDPWESRDSS
ncbi:MAG: FitA-like ribbon-helix-helix domain-containing protein [Microbacterium sp.]